MTSLLLLLGGVPSPSLGRAAFFSSFVGILFLMFSFLFSTTEKKGWGGNSTTQKEGGKDSTTQKEGEERKEGANAAPRKRARVKTRTTGKGRGGEAPPHKRTEGGKQHHKEEEEVTTTPGLRMRERSLLCVMLPSPPPCGRCCIPSSFFRVVLPFPSSFGVVLPYNFNNKDNNNDQCIKIIIMMRILIIIIKIIINWILNIVIITNITMKKLCVNIFSVGSDAALIFQRNRVQQRLVRKFCQKQWIRTCSGMDIRWHWNCA